MEKYAKFRADTRRPAEPMPAGSWDCQIHVFGDPDVYPLRKQSAYPPPADGTVGAGLAMHGALGVKRGVIVQSTAHDTDHSILLDALAHAGPNYRGVEIINDTVSDGELLRLHEAGVRAARFNFWKQLNIAPTEDEFLRSLARIGEYGWHAKVHSAGDEWLGLTDLLDKVKTPIVIDHMGHLVFDKGLEQAPLKMMLGLLERENWWILVSNGDRRSVQTEQWDDALPYARAFIEAAPDRAIWCTDWPMCNIPSPCPTTPNWWNSSTARRRRRNNGGRYWWIIRPGCLGG